MKKRGAEPGPGGLPKSEFNGVTSHTWLKPALHWWSEKGRNDKGHLQGSAVKHHGGVRTLSVRSRYPQPVCSMDVSNMLLGASGGVFFCVCFVTAQVVSNYL